MCLEVIDAARRLHATGRRPEPPSSAVTRGSIGRGLLPTRALFHESWKWLRKNWIRTLDLQRALVPHRVGLERLDHGSQARGLGGRTRARARRRTAQGNTWNGIYWLLCTTILFGLITYGREKGFRNLPREFFTPPFTFFDNLVRRPRSVIAMGCRARRSALLVGSVVSNAGPGLLGLGFLLAAPTAVAIVLNNVLIRGWTGIFSAMQARLKHDAAALANPYAMMFGEAIGALVALRATRTRSCPSCSPLILVVVSFVVEPRGRRRQGAAEPDAADPAPSVRASSCRKVAARDTRARRTAVAGASARLASG